jgi:hypothetical protein
MTGWNSTFRSRPLEMLVELWSIIGAHTSARLLANGARWERELARNIAADAPYR